MKQPDIIFIVLDTQRADRLGVYGHRQDISPNIDQFANEGVLFEQAISPAQWTIPSHASLFTGRYPTAHQVTQSSHSLSPDLPHLAEVIRAAGYETVGFCNNPLVGILNNGFKRGFDTFYNYGGAIPSMPEESAQLPWPLNRVLATYTQFLRRISYPIQNFFGQSDLAFRVSLNAWLTPLWSRFANFKGQNARSVRDVVRFLRQREDGLEKAKQRPLFLFLNLMETHLPFWPSGEFVDKMAPYLRESKEARAIMSRWNREAYRWAAPLAEPLGELESHVLSDMYDAEVAYQDDYLGDLFDLLRRRDNADDTLTLIVADHGDGLGEHGYFGHAFVAYQELVHVPLIMHWPNRWQARRIASPVSTRR
ncbi:MAG: sulfatase, partial [Anaerolineales bacterium]|nr:sulfatase [Anaerolineales bacterium]